MGCLKIYNGLKRRIFEMDTKSECSLSFAWAGMAGRKTAKRPAGAYKDASKQRREAPRCIGRAAMRGRAFSRQEVM